MIAILSGQIFQRQPDSLVVLVGGVGLEVFVPRSVYEHTSTQDEVLLYTRLIVREDALTLYGFLTIPDRDMFDTLLKVSGIGPKLALTILSYMSVDNLRSAVINQRAELFSRVPGVGKKTAEKILLELKDKIPVGLAALPIDDTDTLNNDVMDTLIALGFSIIEAQTAIQSLPPNAPKEIDERVRLALQSLSR